MHAVVTITSLGFLSACSALNHEVDDVISFPGNSKYQEYPESYIDSLSSVPKDARPPSVRNKGKVSYSGTFSIVSMDLNRHRAVSMDKGLGGLGQEVEHTGFAILPYDFATLGDDESASLKAVAEEEGRIDLLWETVPVAELFEEMKTLESFGLNEMMGPENIHPWDLAHLYINKKYARKNKDEVIYIAEPDFLFTNIAAGTQLEREENKAQVGEEKATLVAAASPVWPTKGDIFWYKGNDYSQLDAALSAAELNRGISQRGAKRAVRVAHLDTGYNAYDTFRPIYFDDKNSIDFVNGGDCSSIGQYMEPNLSAPSHGQRFLSVLAGGLLTYGDGTSSEVKENYIGADPFADVRSYRIANKSVVHLRNEAMTKAIYCAIKNEIDIISLSAGGLPSISQRNAVNAAYDRGVAIFAASGDFFHIPLININILGTSTVFPARYSRVMAVAGITANNQSYGVSPGLGGLIHWNPIEIWDRFKSWSFRGSYGPKRIFKVHAISVFAPNIVTSASVGDKAIYRADGGGTSATTPQAAAAASIWLDWYKSEIGDDWNTWKKAEAVYRAMEQSAKGHDEKFSKVEYFGHGPLKARDMLSIDYEGSFKLNFDSNPNDYRKSASYIGFSWISDVTNTSGLVKLFGGSSQEFAVVDMLATEIEQLIYTSRKLNELSPQVSQCYQKNDTDLSCIAKICKLMDLLNERNASETLKANISSIKEEGFCAKT